MTLNKSSLHEKLESIVGSEYLSGEEIIMEAYTEPFSPVTRRQVTGLKGEKPGFIVRPGSTKEVQAIVRLANENKVAIIPVGAMTSVYAETTPIKGAIMLDFSRMNTIEIDEELMTVSLEPGVTWAQAYRDLAVKGYWVSNQASPGSVSIVGTASPAHMVANIALVENELPIPGEVVRELHRRFDELERRQVDGTGLKENVSDRGLG